MFLEPTVLTVGFHCRDGGPGPGPVPLAPLPDGLALVRGLLGSQSFRLTATSHIGRRAELLSFSWSIFWHCLGEAKSPPERLPQAYREPKLSVHFCSVLSRKKELQTASTASSHPKPTSIDAHPSLCPGLNQIHYSTVSSSISNPIVGVGFSPAYQTPIVFARSDVFQALTFNSYPPP